MTKEKADLMEGFGDVWRSIKALAKNDEMLEEARAVFTLSMSDNGYSDEDIAKTIV